MRIGVPKETASGERRVALVPEVVKKLAGQDQQVLVERGAGAGALIPDAQYTEAGATLVDGPAAAFAADRRLGAVVQGFDVRAAVKEQVESLGAKFLEFDLGGDLEGAGGYAKELTAEQQARQQELMAEAIGKVDVVITTALVPGRRAPTLVTEEAVKKMKPGSVIVDLAGEQGGNCELSEPGESIVRHDVKVLAPLGVPSTMAEHASQLYARNIQALLGLMVEDGALKLDFDDEVIAGACITRDGEIVHEGAKQAT